MGCFGVLVEIWRSSALWLDWEATGTWVGGFATVGAIFAALHATRQAQAAAGAAYDLAEKVRADALDDKLREQAKSIYALAVTVGNKRRIRITNRSDLPIYRVSVYWLVGGLGVAKNDGLNLNVGNHWTQPLESWEAFEDAWRAWRDADFKDVKFPVTPNLLAPILSIVPPGGTYQVPGEYGEIPPGPHSGIFRLSRGVEIVFTDASGIPWTRRQDGRLERAQVDPVSLETVQDRRRGWESFMDPEPVDPL